MSYLEVNLLKVSKSDWATKVTAAPWVPGCKVKIKLDRNADESHG